MNKQLANTIWALGLAIGLIATPAGGRAQDSASSGAPRNDRTDVRQTVSHAVLTLDAISQLIASIEARRENAVKAADPARHVFDDVPITDRAYVDITTLEQHHILLGFPAGHFSGKRILTRYEFAVAIHRVLQSGVLVTVAPHNAQSPLVSVTHDDLLLISRLLEEFDPDVRALGRNVPADRVQLKARLARGEHNQQ